MQRVLAAPPPASLPSYRSGPVARVPSEPEVRERHEEYFAQQSSDESQEGLPGYWPESGRHGSGSSSSSVASWPANMGPIRLGLTRHYAQSAPAAQPPSSGKGKGRQQPTRWVTAVAPPPRQGSKGAGKTKGKRKGKGRGRGRSGKPRLSRSGDPLALEEGAALRRAQRRRPRRDLTAGRLACTRFWAK